MVAQYQLTHKNEKCFFFISKENSTGLLKKTSELSKEVVHNEINAWKSFQEHLGDFLSFEKRKHLWSGVNNSTNTISIDEFRQLF